MRSDSVSGGSIVLDAPSGSDVDTTLRRNGEVANESEQDRGRGRDVAVGTVGLLDLAGGYRLDDADTVV